MNVLQLKEEILSGALLKYAHLYRDIPHQKERFIKALDSFIRIYGCDREVMLFSVPGRSEIAGNHTDHNRGSVLAGAIDKDIIAVVSKNEDGIIRFHSDGYPEDSVEIEKIDNPEGFEKYTSRALIAGVAQGFINNGHAVGGYDAYSTSEVLKGSGISSSAAYEVMLGNILNHLYNGGCVPNTEIAVLARYAENAYFGKPCGLMDQMTCAVGGFVYIDLEESDLPKVEPISLSLSDMGYALCIVNTGGNHANLNEDYAEIPDEMRAVAKLLGREVLRGLTEEYIVKNLNNIRRLVGDRAVLRSLHFLRENGRVEKLRCALKAADLDTFFRLIKQSGHSSFEYLQNVYSNSNVKEQGLALALALTEGYLGSDVACRVHGGGFAGTIQVFLKKEYVSGYTEYMNSIFGAGATEEYNVRQDGAVRLF